MSATTTTTTVSVQDRTERKSHSARRATLVASVAGAAATTAFAAATSAAGVPFEIDGKPIPVGGFTTMTLLGAVLGGVLLLVTNRYAAQPRRRFLQATVALTALSCVPSVISPPDAASKIASWSPTCSPLSSSSPSSPATPTADPSTHPPLQGAPQCLST